ncbi:carbohydrate-binding protein [Dyadobacter aurulentus]|uniref:carbohydrate-binding protein n=1 Tax=Dyadobacter sp. UC 10 TaxID=2605428 RepID=UPI0011F0DCFA|nr:carbohydrate-binding protein [Dyadobacter sp. UC 10]KAA0990491.1 carbohydrate-binding protein [Dyadobacter sp. UC 10]
MKITTISKTLQWVTNLFVFLMTLSAAQAASHDNTGEADIDPVSFSISVDKAAVSIGEEFEITIKCVLRPIPAASLATTLLDANFNIRLACPENFEQTGGNYHDYIGEKLDRKRTEAHYVLRGKFKNFSDEANFILLRGTKYSSETGRFLYRGSLKMKLITDFNESRVAAISGYSQCFESESMQGATGMITDDPTASNGKTRGTENATNHYVDYVLSGVPSSGTYKVTLRYYSSSPPNINVKVNGANEQNLNLPNSGAWNIVFAEQAFTVALAAGNNTIRIAGTGGGSCRQDRICVVEQQTVENPVTCSGYNFSEGQIIGSSGANQVKIRLESGCAVACWPDGNRVHQDWIPLLTGKSVPDNILKSCVKWEGQAVNCTGCISPPAPGISKTSGTTVCPSSNQSVTLAATGCTGNVIWFKDGVQVGTGSTITRNDAGSYTATCTLNGCTSPVSAAIVIAQTNNCGNGNDVICSGYTFAEGQVIGSSPSNQVVVHLESGCAVAYWKNGNRTHGDWLPLLSGKTIPDQILKSCVKWEGEALNCTNCSSPPVPTVSKTSGNTVCPATNQSVTLTASNFSGTITWFRNEVQVGSGTTYLTSQPGSYYATVTLNGCVSGKSALVNVSQTGGCAGMAVSPKIASSGFPEVLNLSIVPDPANPGCWLISDNGTVSLAAGYEWSYFVGNKWIKRATNLSNEPWQTNSPGRVVKMATKIGLDTLNRWPCPGDGCGYYYQSDAVQQLVSGARGGLTTFIFN